MGCQSSKLIPVEKIDDNGNYISTGFLSLENGQIMYFDLKKHLEFTWEFTCVKTYGFSSEVFNFEVGRRAVAISGDNRQLFKCSNPKLLFKKFKKRLKQKQISEKSGNNSSSPQKEFQNPLKTYQQTSSLGLGNLSGKAADAGAVKDKSGKLSNVSSSYSAADSGFDEPTHPMVSYGKDDCKWTDPRIMGGKMKEESFHSSGVSFSSSLNASAYSALTGSGKENNLSHSHSHSHKVPVEYVNTPSALHYYNIGYRPSELATPTLTTTPSSGHTSESGSVFLFPHSTTASNGTSNVIYCQLDDSFPAPAGSNRQANGPCWKKGVVKKRESVSYCIPDADKTNALRNAVLDRNSWRHEKDVERRRKSSSWAEMENYSRVSYRE